MPGVGVGGLFANLFNPGLDDRLAQHITPNPNPLAQQGRPAAPGSVDSLGNPVPSGPPPGSNLAPPAVTQPDPSNAANVAALTQPSNAYAADAYKAHRMDQLSADLNRNLEGIAAGFGTAAQQQAKQNALRGGGGGVGDSLAALKDIQGMQDQTIADNEHARFMGNAAIFAQTLSQSLGRPVSVAEATEIMNNGKTLDQFGGAAAGASQSNATKTEAIKNWEQARAAMKAAGKTDAEINAAMPPELLAFGGGTNLSETQYMQEKALATSQGKGADFPDFATWTANHAQAAKETEDAHKVALQLPGLKTQLTRMGTLADDVEKDAPAIQRIQQSTSKKMAAAAIINWDGKGEDPTVTYTSGPRATLDEAEARAVANIKQLHLANYASNFTSALPGQRLSQQEAKNLGLAADQLTNFSGNWDDYLIRLDQTRSRIGHAMTNAHGEARDLDSLPVQYRSKIDPSFLEGPQALKNLPKWAQPVPITDPKDIDKLEYGQAYKPQPGAGFGKYTGKILFKGQEAGYEDY